MTGRELLQSLEAQGLADKELMILDGHNGGGEPRTINMGPIYHKIIKAEADGGADCEGRVGEKVALIGYGCY